MKMVALADLIVEAQHAHPIHHVSQAVLQTVLAAGYLGRHSKHSHGNESMIPLRVAVIEDQHSLHVANHNNNDGRCKEIQQTAVRTATLAPWAIMMLGLPSFSSCPVITASAADGPNGPGMPQITQLLPDAPIVHRSGEINAWDNADFVTAVKNTGRKKLIVAGISTEVCVAFVALSAVQAGYDVYAVIDSSGTWNKLVQEVAIARMAQAGVKPITWVAVIAELQHDWREATGQGVGQIMGEHLNFYGNLIGSFMAARS